MSQTPFFTVAIPTYNRAELLRQAITGLLNQTFRDFELLIADNCSEDHTPEVVKSFDDPRIRYVRHDENRGAVANFEYTFEQARTPYFVAHQDDDLLCGDFLERAHAGLTSDSQAVIFATTFWRGSAASGYSADLAAGCVDPTLGNLVAGEPLLIDGPRLATRFLYSAPIIFPTLAVRCDVLREAYNHGWTENIGGDYITTVRILLQGKCSYDPRIGGVWRVNNDNLSYQYWKPERNAISGRMYHRLVEELDAAGVDWAAALREDLAGFDSGQLMSLARRWVRSDAPNSMIRLIRELLVSTNKRSGLWLWRRMISRIGLRGATKIMRA